MELKQRHGAIIIGPRADAERIPGIDQQVGDGDHVALGNMRIKVFDTPGHTKGHISMYIDAAVHGLTGTTGALFCGDTLFAMGTTPHVLHMPRVFTFPLLSHMLCGSSVMTLQHTFAPQGADVSLRARLRKCGRRCKS